MTIVLGQPRAPPGDDPGRASGDGRPGHGRARADEPDRRRPPAAREARADRTSWSSGPVEVGALTDELESKATALASREWGVESRGQGIVVADRQRLTEAHAPARRERGRRTAATAARSGSGLERRRRETARLWVHDEGRGCGRRSRRAIFDRFRARANGSARSGGSGLGSADRQGDRRGARRARRGPERAGRGSDLHYRDSRRPATTERSSA